MSSSVTPVFDPVLGIWLKAVVLTPYAVSGTSMTAGNPITLTVNTESIRAEIRSKTEKIEPINLHGDNEVEVSRSSKVTVEIFRINNGTEVDPLLSLLTASNADGSRTYSLFELQYTEGNGPQAYTRDYWGSFGFFETGYKGRGKQIATLGLNPVTMVSNGVEIANFRASAS